MNEQEEKKEIITEQEPQLESKETTENNIETPEKKKSINPIILIIALLLILALSVGGFILGTKLANKEDSDNNSKEQTETKSLEIYRSANGGACVEGIQCELVATIPVKNDNAKELEVSYETADEENYQLMNILYSDGSLKIYNVPTKKIKEIKLEDKYDEYEMQVSYDYKDVLGLVVRNKEGYDVTYSAYYDIEKNEIMFENQYTNLSTKLGDFIEVNINASNSNEDFEDEKWHTNIVNLKTKKEVIKNTGVCGNYNIEKINNHILILYHEGCFTASTTTIYKEDGTILVDHKLVNIWEYTKDNNISYADGNQVKTINLDGDVLSTSKTYHEILQIFEGYILYHDTKNLYITDDKDFTTTLMKWKKDYFYHSMISRYYDEGSMMDEEAKDPGYYFIFEYGDSEKGIEFYFNAETKEMKKYEIDVVLGYAKPVLYLYPEEKTEITVNFEKEDNLTTTYPKFKEEWKVTAYPNGDLYDEHGKYYYGLYWEEDSNHKIDFQEGFYVSKDNAIEFLEEKLTIIGLNDKERNEFIMYWLPILEKNEHNLVYFELTEERESFNKLEITPKPDSLLRVAIHIKKVNGKQNIKEQKLESFERNGFVAVEWGGIAYN